MTDAAQVALDVTTGMMKFYRSPGYGNSVVHLFDQAQTAMSDGRPLIAHNHFTTWKPHYADKRIVEREPHDPIFIRQLPTLKSAAFMALASAPVLTGNRMRSLVL